jgi:hypothetical protein
MYIREQLPTGQNLCGCVQVLDEMLSGDGNWLILSVTKQAERNEQSLRWAFVAPVIQDCSPNCLFSVSFRPFVPPDGAAKVRVLKTQTWLIKLALPDLPGRWCLPK